PIPIRLYAPARFCLCVAGGGGVNAIQVLLAQPPKADGFLARRRVNRARSLPSPTSSPTTNSRNYVSPAPSNRAIQPTKQMDRLEFERSVRSRAGANFGSLSEAAASTPAAATALRHTATRHMRQGDPRFATA